MNRLHLAWVGPLVTISLGAIAAHAAPFMCPRVGGEFTFAQSANVNGLDKMTSSAISTRNIAMNMFETLITRIR